jgi:hypothetical protein
MNAQLFELFSDMMECIPSNRILPALQITHERLEEDLLYKRITEVKAANSILSFCQFVAAVLEDDFFSPVDLPVTHVVFYEKIMMRLLAVGAVSRQAKKQFDLNFCAVHLDAFHNQHAAGSNLIPRLTTAGYAASPVPV